MTAGIREWNGWMNGAGGLHAAIAQACRQSKNHRDRNAGEGTELAEESLCLSVVTARNGISLEGGSFTFYCFPSF